MKQKYVLTKSGEKETLTISEYTELEKNIFSLICEESHDGDAIRAAIAQGAEKLISTFRTHNMYPRVTYAGELALGIIEMYRSHQNEKKEFMFDDKDAFNRPPEEDATLLDMVEKEAASVDDLIEDDAAAGEGDLDGDDAAFDESELDSPEDDEE